MDPLPSQRILVIGATGMLGKPVTQQLIRDGFRVSILARNPEKAKRLFPEATVFAGDLKDKESIKASLHNIDQIYLNLSVDRKQKPQHWLTEREGLKNLLDVAAEFPIKRIAYLSSIVMRYQGMNGFHWWVLEVKQDAVKLIKNSGIPYSIFYPSTFMESFTEIQKVGKNLMHAGISRTPMYYIAAKDYAKMVSTHLQSPGESGKEYYVQGPEAYTGDEAAKIFIQNYKREKLHYRYMPLGVLQVLGWFNQEMNYGARILRAMNNYPEKFMSEETWQDLHKPEISLEAFARQASE